MKRITKIAVLAAFAVLATATAASASVAVDANGNGSVGKGDVQTALGGINDNALQTMWKDGKIKFTVNAEKVAADYEMSCYGSTATMHRQIIHFGTATIEATVLLNPQGKVSQGWNLTGKTTGFTYSGGAVRDSNTSNTSSPRPTKVGLFGCAGTPTFMKGKEPSAGRTGVFGRSMPLTFRGCSIQTSASGRTFRVPPGILARATGAAGYDRSGG